MRQYQDLLTGNGRWQDLDAGAHQPGAARTGHQLSERHLTTPHVPGRLSAERRDGDGGLVVCIRESRAAGSDRTAAAPATVRTCPIRTGTARSPSPHRSAPVPTRGGTGAGRRGRSTPPTSAASAPRAGTTHDSGLGHPRRPVCAQRSELVWHSADDRTSRGQERATRRARGAAETSAAPFVRCLLVEAGQLSPTRDPRVRSTVWDRPSRW